MCSVAMPVRGQNPTAGLSARIHIELTFFSADDDLIVPNERAITFKALQELIAHQSSGKKPKLHAWAVRGKTVSVGETFELALTETPDDAEALSIGAAEYGDGGRAFSLALSVLKQRVEARRPSYSMIQTWHAAQRVVVPLDGALIQGGLKGDPLMGKKSDKKLPPQLLYVAYSVRASDEN